MTSLIFHYSFAGFGNLSAVCMLPIFLYTLQLGLNGAAVATVASQYVLPNFHLQCRTLPSEWT